MEFRGVLRLSTESGQSKRTSEGWPTAFYIPFPEKIHQVWVAKL